MTGLEHLTAHLDAQELAKTDSWSQVTSTYVIPKLWKPHLTCSISERDMEYQLLEGLQKATSSGKLHFKCSERGKSSSGHYLVPLCIIRDSCCYKYLPVVISLNDSIADSNLAPTVYLWEVKLFPPSYEASLEPNSFCMHLILLIKRRRKSFRSQVVGVLCKEGFCQNVTGFNLKSPNSESSCLVFNHHLAWHSPAFLLDSLKSFSVPSLTKSPMNHNLCRVWPLIKLAT